MAETIVPHERERGPLGDDYLIERNDERASALASIRLFSVLRAILLLIVAAVSLALFWVVGSILGVF